MTAISSQAVRTRKTGKHWFFLRVCARRFDVRVEEVYAHEGEFLDESDTIVVRRASKQKMHDVLIHEVLHAIFSATGLDFEMGEILNMTSRKWGKLEERLIRALTPVILATCTDAGWLRLPKVPK